MALDKLQFASGNSASTTLTNEIADSDTTAPLTSDTNFSAKSGEGMVIISEGENVEEFAYATGKSGGALTIPLDNRGLEGGAPNTHSSGATVKGIITAGMWNNVIDALAKIVDKTTGNVPGTAVLDEDDMASNSATALATQQSIKAYTDNAVATGATPLGGWINLTGLSYASATTITTASDLTGVLQVGDKLKLTQTTGGTKYWPIINITGTTITIPTTTDYTLVNEAITSPQYSKIENPQGWPSAFNYTPASFVGFSANPGGMHRFTTNGRSITLFVAQTAGTSNATNFEFTAPVPARTVSGMTWDSAASAVRNNSVTEIGTGGMFIGSAGVNIRCARNATSTGWTNTNQKAIIGGQITYEF